MAAARRKNEQDKKAFASEMKEEKEEKTEEKTDLQR